MLISNWYSIVGLRHLGMEGLGKGVGLRVWVRGLG